ncbi:MAG TPA: LysR family transcriptional regulator [Noviherbaspirillum sp.]|uniref:LysR family transcriptional regulator n=1 Tax=Noviherbaspirillum sp. TaxID=1926288 RepID=UPI002B4A10E2|nr:LysR family transcriptional regulator [Noviherbaspirillum sp.]HJV87688.1 LysR family transcriptional regulator [Noviherbaspirillum sp.]
MDTLTSMKVFAAVVDNGSFAAAADRLDISRAMASKYVAHLEEHLGTRLLQRTTRKLTLTESGTSYYDRCVQILADISEAEEGAVSHTEAPHGTLRLTMPVSFGILHMGPIVSDYLRQYQDVKVDLLLNDRRVDLLEEGLDLAVRIGMLQESGLIAKRLASDRIIICAAPEYLKRHGVPQQPADLAQHNCLTYSYAAAGDDWKMTGPNGEHAVRVAGSLRATNGDMIRLAALGGVGLIRQPLFLVGEDIRAGRLVEVLPEYRSDEIGIYAVYPSRKHLSAKVRTFVDFVAAALALKSEW